VGDRTERRCCKPCPLSEIVTSSPVVDIVDNSSSPSFAPKFESWRAIPAEKCQNVPALPLLLQLQMRRTRRPTMRADPHPLLGRRLRLNPLTHLLPPRLRPSMPLRSLQRSW
jgi:hypothetical protein